MIRIQGFRCQLLSAIVKYNLPFYRHSVANGSYDRRDICIMCPCTHIIETKTHAKAYFKESSTHTHTLHHTLTDDSPLSGEAKLAVVVMLKIIKIEHRLKNGSAPPPSRGLQKCDHSYLTCQPQLQYPNPN